jgi:hypothetical protein
MQNRSFITDDEIDKALDYLRDNARDAAQAKADRVYVEEFRKVIKATLMKEHGSLSAVLQGEGGLCRSSLSAAPRSYP